MRSKFKLKNNYSKLYNTCFTDPNDLHVNWIRSNNSSLPEGAYVRSATLYIDNTQPQAAGDYICYGVDRSGRVVFSFTTHLVVIGELKYILTIIPIYFLLFVKSYKKDL